MYDKRLYANPGHNLSVPGPDTPLNATSVIALAEGWDDLTSDRRRRIVSDIKTVVRLTGLPASNVLMTPPYLRQRALSGSAASFGVTEWRMRNIRSTIRFVLRRIGLMDPRDVPLSPEWRALLDFVEPEELRPALIGIARFCSLHGAPPARTHAMGQDFLTCLVERTLTARPRKHFGRVRIVWNRCCATIDGWPGQPLAPLCDSVAYTRKLAEFPESFQKDLAAFGDQLTATLLDGLYDEAPAPLDASNPPPLPACPKPLRATSAALRLDHVRWAASALVAIGMPIEAVTSLASLVTPVERALTILRFFYERAGQKPSAAGMHVAEVLLMIAKFHARLSEQEVARIRRWGKRVRRPYHGMTEKNEKTIRAAMQPHHEAALRRLPMALMEEARQLLAESPLQAGSLALRAVAIGLLSRRPLRLANLCELRLDRHLQRGDPKRGRITHLAIPPEETKNERAISLPIARDSADLLEEWITSFRPIGASPDCVYLFPGYGTGNRPITPQGLRDAIKDTTGRYVGVALSPHQFRHLAARTFLDEHPGEYETVRQLLGHASVATTTRHYSGIEAEASARRFDEAILNRRSRRGRNTAATPLGRVIHKLRAGKR